MPFELDERLKNDTHFLFANDEFQVLLHKNANIPWIIIVPKTQKLELFELTDLQIDHINHLCDSVYKLFQKRFQVEKMNIAAIGNIVSQLHVHAIGRKRTDACWPNVVWGANYDFIAYTESQIEEIRYGLKEIVILQIFKEFSDEPNR
jgi:diadenosine tetraphosphate (Ap4A) HIT family hydrolase